MRRPRRNHMADPKAKVVLAASFGKEHVGAVAGDDIKDVHAKIGQLTRGVDVFERAGGWRHCARASKTTFCVATRRKRINRLPSRHEMSFTYRVAG